MPAPIKVSLEGFYARRDNFGRIVFDLCPTMRAHLTGTNPSDARHLMHLGQFFSEEMLNVKGSFQISIAMVPDECPECDEHCEIENCDKTHGECADSPTKGQSE